jgi:hypothetical protein
LNPDFGPAQDHHEFARMNAAQALTSVLEGFGKHVS